jgi:hypothetical protein
MVLLLHLVKPTDGHGQINLCLLLALLLVSVYGLSLGSDPTQLPRHTIPSACAEHGPCPSRGLTRAIVSIRAGDFEQATQYNANAAGFLWFALSQLLLRVALLSPARRTHPRLSVAVDLAASLAVGAWAFAPLVAPLVAA